MLFIPDEEKEGKADPKSQEPADRHQQLVKILRHFQRDDQKGDRKGKNGIAEGFNALDLETAVTKTSRTGRPFLYK